MADDTDPGTPAETRDVPVEETDTRTERRVESRPGVSIPTWMAAALVVALALGIGGAGFAIGRSTADSGDRQLVPIGAQLPGGGRGGRVIPFGGPRGPGGPGGERGERLDSGERGDHERENESSGGQSQNDTSEQPGEQGAGF